MRAHVRFQKHKKCKFSALMLKFFSLSLSRPSDVLLKTLSLLWVLYNLIPSFILGGKVLLLPIPEPRELDYFFGWF